jgi:hypothetical protein
VSDQATILAEEKLLPRASDRSFFAQFSNASRLMKFRIPSGSIFALSAAAKPNSMNSSCDAPWESVPREILHPALRAALYEIQAHILPIRIGVNLDRFIQFGGNRKDFSPVGA